jgi:uncharacterized protein YyaL (SSP411 family)
MKRTVFYLLAAACILTGCHRMQKFTINGDLAAARLPEDTQTIQLVSEGLVQPLTATVTDGAFSFQGEVENPVLAKFISSTGKQQFYPSVILEKGTITFEDGRPVGTPLNDANKAFIQQLKDIRTAHSGDKEGYHKAAEEAFFAFVSQHKKDPCAVFAILLADQRLAPESILKLIATASPENQNFGEVRSLANRMKRKTQE